MRRIKIGIPVYEEPARLQATLAGLRAHTPSTYELLLLPDGSDVPTQTVLATLHDIPQSPVATPRGAAAYFNRLVGADDADVFVLLESGAVVGPGWLDRLLAALDMDPRNGLAGPSTNRSWNEQRVFPGSADTLDHVVRTAAEAVRRFDREVRTLEPLYSLADFCYAVRRDVIEAIGAVDEGYGLGPCWEMDYNIRAARAGFRGVWACAAYVYRMPFTRRRLREEALRFESSKHRYQDKFCALRLRGERIAYEPHCKGDECEHFAPHTLIQVHLPVGSRSLPTTPTPAVMRSKAYPLVSCIMPTRNRVDYVLQAIRYFQRQDYPERELIILDDGSDDLSGRLPSDDRIHYVRMPSEQSIGAKRNRGCGVAHGSIIAQWDDDDWYAPNRLSVQVAPLLAGEADLTGLTAGVFFDLLRWEFWRCTPDLHRRLFIGGVHGGTLVFNRTLWGRLAYYPNISLAEDAIFLRDTTQRHARLCKLPNDGSFVYLRHARNSWSFVCGQHLDPMGWQRVDEPPFPPEDRAFYLERSRSAPADTAGHLLPRTAAALPLVSCIMPTAGRRAFVPHAIQFFIGQDYTNSELIIVDDGRDAIGDLIPADPRIRYVRLDTQHTIGAKRNLACDLARGEVIVHWDDDDWSAKWRISYQVQALMEVPRVSVCGLSQVLFYDPHAHKAWKYIYPSNQRSWAYGATLCYWRSLWERYRFPDLNDGEDTRFLWGIPNVQVLALSDQTFYVGTVHAGNTSRKQTQGTPWHPFPTEEVRRLLQADWSFYENWRHAS